MEKNLALTIVNPGEIGLYPYRLPELKADEVLIKVHYVAVCGSDVKLYAGSYTAPHKYPVIMGHEWLGTIIDKGSDVKLKTGQKVVGDCSVYCDKCYYCGVSKNHCEHIEKRGITVNGGAAEFIIVKELHVNACIDMRDIKLLTLTEPMSVAVNGICNRVSKEVLQRTRRVLIFGAGGIGLMSLFTLLDAANAEIVITDISREKLERVDSFGLKKVKTICSKEKNICDMDIGQFDLVVEATGTKVCMQAAITLAAPCAHIVCLGHQSQQELDMGMVVKKSLTVYGSNGSTGGFKKAMELIRKYKDYISNLITKTVSFEDAPKAFERGIVSGSDIKVLIEISKPNEQ